MLKKITLYATALLGVLVLFNSCKKEYESIESIDEAKIQAYIKENNLTMTKDSSGFYYQVISNGTGIPFANKDSVFYNFTINNLSGINYYSTAAYSNEGTYLGYMNPEAYRIALTGLNRGAKVRVILPSHLAYGKNGNSAVPSNEIILTEITTRVETTQWAIDDKRITDFLTAKGIQAVKSPSRVYYLVKTVGTGEVVDIGSSVNVKYTGRLLDGTIFDSSTDFDYDATGGVISGWDILLGMQVGTKVRIFIPSDLAYGTSGSGSVPANSVLDFDIEIVEVEN